LSGDSCVDEVVRIAAGDGDGGEQAGEAAGYRLVRVADREGLMRHLAEAGIGTGIHYPVPLHLQRAYEWLGYTVGAFPVTERAASDIISLPMFPGLTGEGQKRVAEGVHAFVSRGSAVMAAAGL